MCTIMCALYSIQYNLEPAHQKSVFLKNFYESSLNQIDERIRYCKLHGLRKESEYKSCSVQLFNKVLFCFVLHFALHFSELK